MNKYANQYRLDSTLPYTVIINNETGEVRTMGGKVGTDIMVMNECALEIIRSDVETTRKFNPSWTNEELLSVFEIETHSESRTKLLENYLKTTILQSAE